MLLAAAHVNLAAHFHCSKTVRFGLALGLWMDFRSEGMEKSVNLSSFLRHQD